MGRCVTHVEYSKPEWRPIANLIPNVRPAEPPSCSHAGSFGFRGSPRGSDFARSFMGWPPVSAWLAMCRIGPGKSLSKSKAARTCSTASSELAERPPVLSRIDRITCESIPVLGEAGFVIRSSEAGAGGARFSSRRTWPPATTAWPSSNPADRRYRYPFLNCTNCGPRLTIITGAPYDRAAHDDGRASRCARLPGRVRRPGQPALPRPADRLSGLRPAPAARSTRPAQPIADRRPARPLRRGPARRPDRGPQGTRRLSPGLRRAQRGGRRRAAAPQAPRREAVRRHGRGRGRGGGARPRSGPAERDAAVVAAPADRAAAQARPDAVVADEVAPGNPFLGVMLPYTPLHHLLLRGAGRRAARHDQRQPLRRADRLPRTTTRCSSWPASPTCS